MVLTISVMVMGKSFNRKTMSVWRTGLVVLIYCSSLGCSAETVNPHSDSENDFKTPYFTSRKLLNGRYPYYDYDTVKKFEIDDAVAFLRKTEEVSLFCREIKVMAHGRLFKPSEPIVFDAMVTDKRTNIQAVVRTCIREDDAIRWAKEGLIEKLYSDGLIDECTLTTFNKHVTSGDCKPNTKINCSTSCNFHCDTPGLNLIGISTITCQTGGTLSADQPTCAVQKCSIPALPPHLTSKRVQCSQELDIDYETSCEFSCEQKYSLNGSSIIICLADGTLSGPIPTCSEIQHDEGVSTSPTFTTHPSDFTKKDTPTPTRKITTPMSTITNIHEIPVSREGTSTPSTSPSSTSLKPENESGKGTTTSGMKSNPHKMETGYFALVAIPAIIILFAVPFLISALKKANRNKQYHYLDDRHEIQENQEGWFGADEESSRFFEGNSDISPDVDGYYRNRHILPAHPISTQLDPHENYDMASRQKGIVFILNNNNFPDGRFRKGSEIDVKNVTHVFCEIGYRPQLYQDLTGNEIRNALSSLVDRIECCHNSVVLVLMSHGEEAGILGVDGNLVTMTEIKDRFSGRNCPALLAKPKIIFVQACRGNTMTRCATDTGFRRSEALGHMTTDSLFHSATNDFPLACVETWFGVDTDCNVPDNADMYIAHATSEGYFSMRDRVNGSWFIQALCEELIAGAHLVDLDTIMTRVTRRVKRREAKIKVQGQEHRALQTPQTIKQGIGKQIYFLPKYPPTGSEELINFGENVQNGNVCGNGNI